MLISAQDKRPRRGDSGQPSKYVPVDQNVGVRKGPSSGQHAKMAALDLTVLKNEDGSYNVDECRALADKWQGEIDLFDAAAKGGEEYSVKWGGEQRDVRKNFTKLTKCKQTVEGERLMGAPLMRHYIAFLRSKIAANASSGDDDSI